MDNAIAFIIAFPYTLSVQVFSEIHKALKYI